MGCQKHFLVLTCQSVPCSNRKPNVLRRIGCLGPVRGSRSKSMHTEEQHGSSAHGSINIVGFLERGFLTCSGYTDLDSTDTSAPARPPQVLLLSDGAGALVGRPNLPRFRDILHYLDYLKLDEPIIGLYYLKEIPSDDLQAGVKYVCTLCKMNAFLPEMVHHVIGRKHRQKYVETQRPDLVTWDTQSVTTQGGRIIRAKAEIIERQDGRGIPVPMSKMGNQGNLRVSPRQGPNWDRPVERIPQGQAAPLLPEVNDYQYTSPNRRTHPSDPQNIPGFQPEDPYMSRGRPNQWEDAIGHNRVQDEPQRSQMYRDNFAGPDPRAQCEFDKDPQGRAPFQPGERAPVQDFREMPPRSQAQHGEYYPEKEALHERAFPERGASNDFYPEERGRGQIHSLNYKPEGEKPQWSREQESSRHDSMYREDVQDFCEPEAKRSTFSSPMNVGQEGRFFRNYRHERRPPNREEADNYTHPEGAAAPTSQRAVGVTRAISDIPEPFRRFLTGATSESYGKRKRKSRFSDATPEELEMTREMFRADSRSPKTQFSHKPNAPLRHENSGMQYSDQYSGTEDPHYTDSYQRGGANSDGVFDVLKNIEIENAEQADFLKNKLCGLLKEFKSKKMEKEAHNSQNRPDSFRNYSDSKLEPQLPRQSLYERSPRQDTDHREPMRDRREHRPEQQHQEYPHPLHAEPRHPNRGHYGGMFETPHGSHLDEPPYYPERFQEPLRSHDYQPAVKEFYDSALPMEQGSRMNRGPRHSNSLDKIASTLLELVSKK